MPIHKLKCDICGGQIEMQGDGQRGICINCGTAYSVERMRNMFAGLKVSVTGSQEDVEQWRQLVHKYYNVGDFQEAERIVKKILEALPSDEEANRCYDELQVLKYMNIKDGVLLSYSGSEPNVVIPSFSKEISTGAFRRCSNLHNVVIPNSVTAIGGDAFAGTALKNVTIPNSVSSIESGTFANCFRLQSVVIPNSVTFIGKKAFFNCSSLRSVNIPSSVFSIGEEAFSFCSNMKIVNVNASVQSIGNYAFDHCSNLQYVTIPDRFISDSIFDSQCPWYKNKRQTIIRNREKEIEIQKQDWKNMCIERNLCQYCGGEFGGAFKKKCKECGKPKDY